MEGDYSLLTACRTPTNSTDLKRLKLQLCDSTRYLALALVEASQLLILLIFYVVNLNYVPGIPYIYCSPSSLQAYMYALFYCLFLSFLFAGIFPLID